MMSDVEISPALDTRLASLRARMRDARITEADIKTFQKVATIMGGESGRIDGDDLIAASFVLDEPLNPPHASTVRADGTRGV
jgi:hypothetical protein